MLHLSQVIPDTLRFASSAFLLIIVLMICPPNEEISTKKGISYRGLSATLGVLHPLTSLSYLLSIISSDAVCYASS